MLKKRLWTRRVTIEAKVVVIWENQVVEKTTLMEEIRRNQTREQEVQKELEKDKEQAWEDDEIVYIDRKIYILSNRKIWEQILQENHDLVDIEYLGQ